MKQAASIKDLELDVLLPGIMVNTAPTDFAPIQQVQLQVFKGDRWNLFGEVYDASSRQDERPHGLAITEPPALAGGFSRGAADRPSFI